MSKRHSALISVPPVNGYTGRRTVVKHGKTFSAYVRKTSFDRYLCVTKTHAFLLLGTRQRMSDIIHCRVEWISKRCRDETLCFQTYEQTTYCHVEILYHYDTPNRFQNFVSKQTFRRKNKRRLLASTC